MTAPVVVSLDGGWTAIVAPQDLVLHLQRLVLSERPRRSRDGLPWPSVLREFLVALAESEAKAQGHAGVSPGSVVSWLESSSLAVMTTRAAAEVLGVGLRRVQQLVEAGSLSRAGHGLVVRAEVEALLAARESRGA